MKAVLVIDIPETIKRKYLGKEITVQLWDDSYIMHDTCELRPLPKKRIVLEHRIGGYIVNGVEMTQAHGWNACLDEITGETE